MKRATLRILGIVVVMVGLGIMAARAAEPMGTAFTYQGFLREAGVPADGDYDFVFTLYEDDQGTIQVGQPLVFDGVLPNPGPITVTNGQFTVVLDFGTGIFTGDARWLAIEVRDTGVGDYVELGCQEITPMPHALYGKTAGSAVSADTAAQADDADLLDGQEGSFYQNASNINSGTLADARIAGTIARDSEIMPTVLANDGPGSGLNADLLDGYHASSFVRHVFTGVCWAPPLGPGTLDIPAPTYGGATIYLANGNFPDSYGLGSGVMWVTDDAPLPFGCVYSTSDGVTASHGWSEGKITDPSTILFTIGNGGVQTKGTQGQLEVYCTHGQRIDVRVQW